MTRREDTNRHTMTIERLLPRKVADMLRFHAYRLERTERAKPSTTCCDCKSELPLKVCQSHAGYYLGYFCNNCGPYDRVSGYFDKHEDADAALKKRTEAAGDTDGDITDEGGTE